jgi:hypothetical protein
MNRIEAQSAVQNDVFFFRAKEILTESNCSSTEFNPLLVFVFLKRGNILK